MYIYIYNVFKNYRGEIKKIINLAKNITRPDILSSFFLPIIKDYCRAYQANISKQTGQE